MSCPASGRGKRAMAQTAACVWSAGLSASLAAGVAGRIIVRSLSKGLLRLEPVHHDAAGAIGDAQE
eukprot:8189708-Alexandrium_andersonii.AAC.1